jgi:hypothetical protein
MTDDLILIDTPPAHLRPYSFAAGDQRFFTHTEAVAVAQLRVKDRGCRQQVRPVHSDEHHTSLIPRWLVQDAS